MNTPVVVSGFPRSGTSMMMRMLSVGGITAAADGGRDPDQYNPYGYYEFGHLRRMSKDGTLQRELKGKCVKIMLTDLNVIPSGMKFFLIIMKRAFNESTRSQANVGIPVMSEDAMRDVYFSTMKKLETWNEVKSWITVDYADVLKDPMKTARVLKNMLGKGLNLEAMAQVPDETLYTIRSRSGYPSIR